MVGYVIRGTAQSLEMRPGKAESQHPPRCQLLLCCTTYLLTLSQWRSWCIGRHPKPKKILDPAKAHVSDSDAFPSDWLPCAPLSGCPSDSFMPVMRLALGLRRWLPPQPLMGILSILAA